MDKSLAREKNENRLKLHMILEAIEGIFIILACYLTLFLKPLRDRWGLSIQEAKRLLPGDEFITEPKNQFTHGIKINAPAHACGHGLLNWERDGAAFTVMRLWKNWLVSTSVILTKFFPNFKTRNWEIWCLLGQAKPIR